MSAWGLTNGPMAEDRWDYVHITCLNFLPFLLRRVGEAPAWAVRSALGVWFGGLASLAATLLRIRYLARQSWGNHKA
jgi:hypothetical protein